MVTRFQGIAQIGDRILVTRNAAGPAAASQPELDDRSQQPPFAFQDFHRTSPLLILALGFVALVLVLGRWHGARALIGLGVSLCLVIEFLAPRCRASSSRGSWSARSACSTTLRSRRSRRCWRCAALTRRSAAPPAGRGARGRPRPPRRDCQHANTLVLANAGAALPVLLIFNTAGTPLGDAVNGEPVAEQVVAMLGGSIGLIAAVPLTTAIAALFASRMPGAAVPDEHHAH